MASRHRRHGLPSSRTRPRALHGSRHPQPRDQSLHSSNKRGHFQTQYAVLVHTNPPTHPIRRLKSTLPYGVCLGDTGILACFTR